MTLTGCTHRDGFKHEVAHPCPYNDRLRRALAAQQRARLGIGYVGFVIGLITMHLAHLAT